MAQDLELDAMKEVVEALDKLELEARSRVLKYVIERFGIELQFNNKAALKSEELPFLDAERIEKSSSTNKAFDSVVDIFSLKEQKKPKSAIQMVVLVAYYLQEVVQGPDRKTSINAGDVEKYFKQARFQLPTGKNGAKDAMNNAKRAGYLEAAGGRGEFSLNPVGYNLVVHRMPEASV